jgi:hypothetical protein
LEPLLAFLFSELSLLFCLNGILFFDSVGMLLGSCLSSSKGFFGLADG